MGCKNCGNGNRHKQDVPLIKSDAKTVITNDGPRYMSVSEDLDGPRKAPIQLENNVSPSEAFEAAKLLSYDEIITMTKAQQEAVDRNSEEAIRNMTVPMKKFHVISLLGVVNYDITTMAGVSPGQALIGLSKLLDRDDFECIREMYPTLKEKVDIKVEKLLQDRIIID